MSSNNLVTKAVYIPSDQRLRKIYIPPDVPAMHTIRSYWDKERGRPPTSPTNYLNLKEVSEEWNDNNDNRNEEGNAEENNDNASEEDINEIDVVDNEFFNYGVKLIFL